MHQPHNNNEHTQALVVQTSLKPTTRIPRKMDVGFNEPEVAKRQHEVLGERNEDSDLGTVFVRGLSPTVDDSKLLHRFSDVGPVKSAFVVREGAGGVSKGFGFVKFAIQSDAEVAIETLHGATLEGRTIGVFSAQRKERVDTRDEAAVAAAAEARMNRPARVADDVKEHRRHEELQAKQERLEERIGEYSSKLLKDTKRRLCVILLWNIPPKYVKSKAGVKQWLAKREIDVKRLKNVIMNIDAQDPMLAAVNAKPAVAIEFENAKFAKAVYDRLKLAKALARRHAAVTFKRSSRRKCRLIIRNLAWSVREPDLLIAFSQYGPIEEIRVPTAIGNDSRIRGFGFVQFMFHADAIRALKRTNGMKVKGREVAVDWTQEAAGTAVEAADENALVDHGNEEYDGSSSSSSDSSNSSGDEEEVGSDSDEEGGSSGDEDDNSSGDVDERICNEQEPEVNAEDTIGGSRFEAPKAEEFAVFVQNLPFDATKRSVFNVFNRYGACKMVKIVVQKHTGQSRGVAFVHYYTQAGVNTALAAGNGKPFSSSSECNTEQDDGGGKNKKKIQRMKAIKEAVVEASLNGGILLGERLLKVLPAVKKDKLSLTGDKKEERKKVDKRHLYLAREGVIKADDETSKFMPKGDRSKRASAEAEKKLKLKNPNFFVSPVRLSIRNISPKQCKVPDEYLPRNYVKTREEEESGVYRYIDGKILKSIALNAARDGMTNKVVRRNEGDPTLMSTKDPIWEGKRVKVTEAKVICDELLKTADGNFVSKGYGFVEFTEHAHALAALRMLNNNPSYFQFTPGPCTASTPTASRQRLIVEFAVEDARKVLQRRKNLEMAQQKSAAIAKVHDAEKLAKLSVTSKNKRIKGKKDGAQSEQTNDRTDRGKRARVDKRSSERRPTADKPVFRKVELPPPSSLPAQHDTPAAPMASNSTGKESTMKKQSNRKRMPALDSDDAGLETQRRAKKKQRKLLEAQSEKKFDSLVNKYKDKLAGVGGDGGEIKKTMRSRWFD